MGGLLGLAGLYLFCGGVTLVAAVVLASVLILRRLPRPDRRAVLATFAARNGLSFDAAEHPWHEGWYVTFDLLARERPREQRNIMMGRWRGLQVAVLDYDYEPIRLDEEPQPDTASRTVAIVYLPWSLPGVIIEPNATNRLMGQARSVLPRAYQLSDDALEEVSSLERRYVLLAEDQGALARILHPEMKAFLLNQWGLGVEAAGAAAVFFAYCLLRPAGIKELLDFAAAFCELIPDELKTEQGSSVGSDT